MEAGRLRSEGKAARALSRNLQTALSHKSVIVMMKRSAIFCMAAIILMTAAGCEVKTRYKVLCLLFDGVPPPPGMEPCDSDGMPMGSRSALLAPAQNEGRQYSQHGPYAARMCEGCHKRQSNELLLAKEDLCFNCHDLSINKRIVHGPVASGSCVVCHDPHGSGNKYLLVAKSQQFCLHCHRKEDILKTDAHQDMDAGCTTCHNAHASDNDYLLISLAAERYKAKLHTPPRASRPKKEQASGVKQGQPTTSSSKQGRPSTSSTTQESPSTSSGLVPGKSGNKIPTSSGTPPLSPGADLKQKRISQNTPVTQTTGRRIELSEATQNR